MKVCEPRVELGSGMARQEARSRGRVFIDRSMPHYRGASARQRVFKTLRTIEQERNTLVELDIARMFREIRDEKKRRRVMFARDQNQ